MELTISEIQTQIELNKKIQFDVRNKYPLDSRLLRCLLELVSWETHNDYTIQNRVSFVINYNHSVSACGCMGTRNNHPYCGCIMYMLLNTYKYELVLSILFNRV